MGSAAPTTARARVTPTRVAQEGARTLAITWGDGALQRFDVRALRLACRCARCVDEWTGETRRDEQRVPADVRPLRVQNVGRYALQIEWSDGHDSGIYPFQRLRALGDASANADEDASH